MAAAIRCAVPSSKVGSGAFETRGPAGLTGWAADAFGLGGALPVWAEAGAANIAADSRAAETRASGLFTALLAIRYASCIRFPPATAQATLSVIRRSPRRMYVGTRSVKVHLTCFCHPIRQLWPADGQSNDRIAEPARLPALDRHPDGVQ